jgi:hypothetical protein
MKGEFKIELRLERMDSAGDCMIGKLYVDEEFECYTLEDPERSTKIHGKTAIPAGRYEAVITQSLRFCRELPLLLNVPNFEGVRIHLGNTAGDTEGCILVGATTNGTSIGQSKPAFDRLFDKLKTASINGKIFMELA